MTTAIRQNSSPDIERQGGTEGRAASSEACGGCVGADPADLLLLCDGCAAAAPHCFDTSCNCSSPWASKTVTKNPSFDPSATILISVLNFAPDMAAPAVHLAAERTAQPRGTSAACRRRCRASRPATGCALPAPRTPPSPAPCRPRAQSGEPGWHTCLNNRAFHTRYTYAGGKTNAVRAACGALEN